MKTSSVIWSSQRELLNDALASADNKKKLIESDPLVTDGAKLIPSITHVFRKDQNLYVYLEVYDPGVNAEAAAADRKPSVSATLSFYRGKTKTSNRSRCVSTRSRRSVARPCPSASPPHSRPSPPDVIPLRSTSWMRPDVSLPSSALTL